MKPTSFWLELTLTPQCHWGNQPGGRRALRERAQSLNEILVVWYWKKHLKLEEYQIWEELPEQELGGVVKSEHVVIIFNIVLIEKRVKLLELVLPQKKRLELYIKVINITLIYSLQPSKDTGE